MIALQSMMNTLLAAANPDEAVAGLMAAFAGIWLFAMLLGLAGLAFAVYCWWRIFEKAGFGGPYAFLFCIPGFGPLIVVLLLAFGDWPALRNRSA